MARRISGGLVGQPTIGAIAVEPQAVITAKTNQNITVSPVGTATMVMTNTAQINSANELRFYDDDNSNYLSLKSPPTVATNATFNLPLDGTNGQVLSTNGSGTLSFIDPGVTLTNNNTDSNIHNISITTQNSGVATGFRVADSKLRFQPSTGVLFSSVVTGNTTASGTLTLRSTTNGSKGRVIIDETTTSTSTTTGALTIGGGVGVGENLNVGGTVSVTGIAALNGGATGVLDTSFVTTTSTLPDIDKSYLIVATSAFTVTLPNTNSDGRTIKIFDGGDFSSNNITLARNGKTINGAADNLVLDISAPLILIYNDGDWEVKFYS